MSMTWRRAQGGPTAGASTPVAGFANRVSGLVLGPREPYQPVSSYLRTVSSHDITRASERLLLGGLGEGERRVLKGTFRLK